MPSPSRKPLALCPGERSTVPVGFPQELYQTMNTQAVPFPLLLWFIIPPHKSWSSMLMVLNLQNADPAPLEFTAGIEA
jgi:hypothetical protein